MWETKRYRNFINGRYFSEGIRMAAGIAMPAFLFGYFNMLTAGLAVSTGALCVSITDSAGPARHRANGMFFCNIVIAVVAMVTYGSLYSVFVMGAEIFLFGFIFSMLSVYNARVSSVGIAALLIMILCMQAPLQGKAVFIHVIYFVIGGTWYLLFSLALHRLRPYKIIQQVSGEFVIGVSEYLASRASFYDDHPDYENTYRSLLQQQVKIRAQQVTLDELLFKTRAITKNSTRAGRALLKIYIDVSDLFESIMSVYQQYEVLHKRFDETGILDEYRRQLLFLADELAGIGESVGSGRSSFPTALSRENLNSVREKFEELRNNFMSEGNIDDFIGLGRIYNNIRDLTEKIGGLHYYTRYEKNQRNQDIAGIDLQKFNEEQTIDPVLFINNLNLNSTIFRHSLRVAFSLLAGYLVSLFFNIGHSYWILLTIVVILKPAYSLTKARNVDRLLGTLGGVLIGVGFLFIVKGQLSLLIFMVIFMAAGYMFIRTKYLISVLLMTVFLVIFFHLIYPSGLKLILSDRLLDTFIGSVIAFVSSLFFVPAWEHEGIKKFMIAALEKEIGYFKCLAKNFTGEDPESTDLKRSRQQAFTALANVSDALTRMLSEPKRFQKNTQSLYRFVVLNNIMASHFSALAFYLANQKNLFRSPALQPVVIGTIEQLEGAVNELSEEESIIPSSFDIISKLHEETNELLQKRKAEVNAGEFETDTKKKLIATKSVIDQFGYIYNLSSDIFKNVREFAE